MTRVRPVAAAAMLLVFATAPLLLTPVGAQQLSDRAKQIGGKLTCGVGTPMCNCKQILTQCNHVGCANSAMMLRTLEVNVAKGDTEESIIQGFIQEYGREVLAEPPKSGFSLIAWILPSFYLVAGTGLVVFVISRWRKRPATEPGPGGGGSAAPRNISSELLDRARAQAAHDTED